MTENIYWTDPVAQEAELRRTLIADSQRPAQALVDEIMRRHSNHEPMTVDMTVRASIVGIEYDSDNGVTFTIALPGSLFPWAPASSEIRVRPESVTAWRFVD